MAQHQVETIRDRTQQGVRYAMTQGATVGRLPYGKAYSRQLDAGGRRVVVDVPEQIATVARIKELHAQGVKPPQIAKALQSENRPTASNADWKSDTVRRILQREGVIAVKALDRTGHIRDPQKALDRIKELRSTGLSLREIGRTLSTEKIAPPRGKRWYTGTVSDILSKNTISDKVKATRLAAKLRDSGMSLRKIGEQLMINSITPPKGGYWICPSSANASAEVGSRRCRICEDGDGAVKVIAGSLFHQTREPMRSATEFLRSPVMSRQLTRNVPSHSHQIQPSTFLRLPRLPFK